MTVLRIDVERALDELVVDEEGMRFQGLAVILAKQKWPDLVARERKRDEGLDAYAPALLAPNGIGKGLACSTTATLTKVKFDAKKIRERFRDVTVLIFATPAKVTGITETEWANSIKQEYDLNLVVMSREDLVTQLMLPGNAALLRSQLRIAVPLEAEIAEVQERAQEAATEVIASWFDHPRLAGRPRMLLQAIGLDENGRDTEILFDLQGLRRALLEGRRVVLEAPAGRGKTTMLLQLAESMSTDALPLLVDLPAWLASTSDVLEFIARSQPFRSRGIDAAGLARLVGATSCAFLLNGWNEVSDQYASKAQMALAALEREFPSAGVIVATRTHYISPPLPGSSRARIPMLTRTQRMDYFRQALGARANELRGLVERDRVLDDLTRTPLILAEVTSLFLSGRPIPKTRMAVLAAAFELAEQGEHRGHLVTAPLYDRGRDYLAALALEMTSLGAVAIGESDARRIVHSVSISLNAAGQIATQAEPATILSTLTAHHLLDRIDYPVVAFRFEHQQFQEFLAAVELGKRLRKVIDEGDPDLAHEFARTCIDPPVWEEPLQMVAEEIGTPANAADEGQTTAAGVRLIELTLTMDPVFSAVLAQLCGPGVWNVVGRNVGGRLRVWRQMADDNHRRCALAGMIASGSADFADVLIPLLTSDDAQVRLETYRAWREFRVSSVGSDWRQIVRDWKEESRIDFVTELRHDGDVSAILEEFAATDSSMDVREAALQTLSWLGETESVVRVMARFNDDDFAQVVKQRILLDLPEELKPRVLRTYQRLMETAGDPFLRLRTRLRLAEVETTDISEAVKGDLTAIPPGPLTEADQELVRSALEIIERRDQPWVSEWVATRIANGSVWAERWERFVSTIPEALRESLLDRLGNQELQYPEEHRATAVLARAAEPNFVGQVFTRLRVLRGALQRGVVEGSHANWAIARQLRDLIRAVPLDVSIAGILGVLSPTPELFEYEIVTDLFSPERGDEVHLRDQLTDSIRQPLRQYLKVGLSLVLAQDDFAGGLKAHSAMALAMLGDPGDLTDLERLINADIERVSRGQVARVRGERSEQANGAAMRWSTWYLRSVFWLDPKNAERVFLKLLSQPEYELDAAKALVKLTDSEIWNRPLGSESPNYADISNARQAKASIGAADDHRKRYATAVTHRIAEIRREHSEQTDSNGYTSEAINMRLRGLATTVAALDGRDSVDLVMEMLRLPGTWDNWIKADALEALLLRGARLPAEDALRILDPVIETLRGQLYDQQAAYLMRRFLSLLPFIEPCRTGIRRLREVIANIRLTAHEFRPIVTALGHSRCSEAAQLLVDIAVNTGSNFTVVGAEWIDAVAAMRIPESELALLGFVDPTLGSKVLDLRLDHYHLERIAHHISEVACRQSSTRTRLFTLCKTPLREPSRAILAHVMSELQTEEAMIACLELVDDRATPSIPYGLSKGIDNFVLERRPFQGSSSTYSLESRNANGLRARLFALLMNDSNRKRSAWELLGQIESWRLDYGRPGNEPRHPAIESGKPWPPLEDVTSFAA